MPELRDPYLVLHLEEGDVLRVAGSTLLVFIDETGEETTSDPNAPIFGLGGLIVEARNYVADVEEPWYQLKEDHFEGVTMSLHAADLGKVAPEKIEAFNSFFSGHKFGRFASTCVDETLNQADLSIQHILFSTLWDRIKEVANDFLWHDILVIFEENERLKPDFERCFMSLSPQNSKGEKIDVRYVTHQKDPTFAGMEVADFIIHTAGRQARLLRGSLFDRDFERQQPDFKQVFHPNVPKSYLNLSRVTSGSKVEG